MPRVSDVYSLPAGTVPVVADTSIESTKYNQLVGDIEQDLNIPRPILRGGTGATTATGARTALQAERAMQVVTNFDTHTFEAGSFYAAAGATSAPTANAQYGTALVSDANNITIEARDFTNAVKYVRRKTAGTWGSWSIDGAAAEALASQNIVINGGMQIAQETPSGGVVSLSAAGTAAGY